ncbi:hypothetical protein [Sideroxydans sp.]
MISEKDAASMWLAQTKSLESFVARCRLCLVPQSYCIRPLHEHSGSFWPAMLGMEHIQSGNDSLAECIQTALKDNGAPATRARECSNEAVLGCRNALGCNLSKQLPVPSGRLLKQEWWGGVRYKNIALLRKGTERS